MFAGLDALRFQIRRIGHERIAHDQREDSNRHVNIKNPAPAVIVGDVAAKSRTNNWREQRGDSKNGLGCALFLFRKGVEQYALTGRLQSAAGETLQNPRGDQHVQASGHSAQRGRDREYQDRQQKIIAAAEPNRNPPGNWENDGVRGEITGDDPFTVGDGRRQSAGNVTQRNIRDRRV